MGTVVRPIEYDPQRWDTVAQTHGVSVPFARLLLRRGLQTDAEIREFLNPTEAELPDPWALLDMDRAAARVAEAIRAEEPITVYGDYDSDGVCATAILVSALRALGGTVDYYIPDRRTEGYGMRSEVIRRLYEKGTRLIVTVDNGISAHTEAQLCKAIGMGLVITDHHRMHATLPEAEAVVCATRQGQAEALHDLCGAGVALLLIKALGCDDQPYLPIAALATVADVVPLVRYNRTIVAKGLEGVHRVPGLAALLETAAQTQPITETTLAFVLAPRINAAGRMGDAGRAVRLLLETDERECKRLAHTLEEENAARRAEEARILSRMEQDLTEEPLRLLMTWGEDWNVGVIGIVASRLLERFGCPVLLFSGNGDTLVGSGRSPASVDLFGLLSEVAPLLERFGGHAQAAGFTVKKDRFSELKAALEQRLEQRFLSGFLPSEITAEDVLSVSDCTVEFAEELQRLAPFGEGNREPVFSAQGTLRSVYPIGKDGAHLQAKLCDGEQAVKLVGWRMGAEIPKLQQLIQTRVTFVLKRNEFRGVVTANAQCLYLQAPHSETLYTAVREALKELRFHPLTEHTVAALVGACDVGVEETALRQRYRILHPRMQTGWNLRYADTEELLALAIFAELGLIRFDGSHVWNRSWTEKKEITDSRIFQALAKGKDQPEWKNLSNWNNN